MIRCSVEAMKDKKLVMVCLLWFAAIVWVYAVVRDPAVETVRKALGIQNSYDQNGDLIAKSEGGCGCGTAVSH